MVVIQSGDFSEQEINEKLDELITLDTAGMFICSFCAKSTRNRGHMREHVESHVDGLQFSCNFCEKSYRSRTGLRTHYSRNPEHNSKVKV